MEGAPEARRYEVLQTLGKGGFGTVYRAKLLGDGGFSKQVALKVLNEDVAGNADFAKRLRDEARILGLIRHRAIVQVDGLAKLNNRWTVVMEYVDGIDVHALFDGGPVPPGPALEVIGEVGAALHAAWHTVGPNDQPLHLLHRDIKPGNVQLTAGGEVKLLDFGVARADFEGREAKTRSVRFGSMGYLSPERFDGEDVPGGDVYALGILLYEMVLCERLGQPPFKPAKHAEHVAHKLQKVRNKLGPRGEPVAMLLGELLAYDPNKRPSAREVERRCAEAKAEVRGESLRDFAERMVPKIKLRRQKSDATDQLTGQVLIEGTQAIAPGSPLSKASGVGLVEPTFALDKPKTKAATVSRSRKSAGSLLIFVGGFVAVVVIGVFFLLLALLGVAIVWSVV